jgi:protein-S-isoprenylcysteine O-methyltransferase Ste14
VDGITINLSETSVPLLSALAFGETECVACVLSRPVHQMKASEFEFRHRALINLVQIWLAFQVYVLDHSNIVWWLCPWSTPRGALWARFAFSFAALLVGGAAVIRTWAAAYLGSDIVHDLRLHTESLVADGPYRHVRNPLYLGSFLLSIGLGFLASRMGFFILVVGGSARILRLIGREEEDLEHEQGERFHEFARSVPRLLPSISPRVPAGGLAPHWGNAFRAEAPMWGFFVTMIAFTISLRDSVAWTLGLASLVLWFTLRVGERRRNREKA